MDAAQRVRALHFQRAVPISVQDRAAIMDYVDGQIEDDRLANAVGVYRALGLLPPDIDVRQLLLRLLGEQIVGYYDSDRARLVVRDDVMHAFGRQSAARDVDLEEARVVLVHELVHALQDQNLGLSENLEQERDSDQDTAFRALLEGDATLAMIGYALEREGLALTNLTRDPASVRSLSDVVRESPLAGSELANAPAIVRVPLLAAYVDGLAFAAHLHGQGGWAAVNRAHRRPPESTEQILHPRYFALQQAPDRVRLPTLEAEARALGAGLVHEDTLGELEIGVYFGQALPEREAARAADGWGGDRLYAFRTAQGGAAVVWIMSWDSDSEAGQAMAAAERVRTSQPSEGHVVARLGRRAMVGRGLTGELRALAERQLAAMARGDD